MNDWDSSGNGRFKVDRHLVFRGQGKNFLSPFRKQGLVSRHHDATRADGSGGQLEGFRRSADQFDNDADLRIFQQILPAVGKKGGGGGDVTGLL